MILLCLKERFRKHRNLKWLNDNSSIKGKKEIWKLLKGRSADVSLAQGHAYRLRSRCNRSHAVADLAFRELIH